MKLLYRINNMYTVEQTWNTKNKGLTNLPQTKSSLKKCHSTVLSEYTV